MCWEGGKKVCFFKTFHNDAVFTVRELTVRYPVKGNNPFGVQRGQRKCEISSLLQCVVCH